MEINYLCPKCRGYLNVSDHVIFSAETENKKVGLVLLSPELGDYSVKVNPSFKFEKGEKLLFFCPICHYKLTSNINENLAKIIMIDEKNNEFEIYFSRVYGEHCTYQVSNKLESFGEDSSLYINFFNLIGLK